MRYRLVAIDLMGTLLEPGGALDPHAVDLIGRAQDLSVRFAFVTELPPTTAAAVARRMDIAAYLIGYAGAITQSPGDRDTLAAQPLDRSIAIAVLDRLAGRVDARLAGYADRVVADAPAPAGRPISDWLLTTPRQCDDLVAEIERQPEPPLALLGCGEPAELDALAAELGAAARLASRLTPIRISPHALEIVTVGVSKGRALTELADRLGIPRSEVLAIGNSAGDTSLLAAAGLGCAVASAAETLKASAAYTATRPLGQGVAEIMERCVLART